MGQKVNPTGIRLGIVKDHPVWYADKSEYSARLLNDLQVRKYLDQQLKNASVSASKSGVRHRMPRSPSTRLVRVL